MTTSSEVTKVARTCRDLCARAYGVRRQGERGESTLIDRHRDVLHARRVCQAKRQGADRRLFIRVLLDRRTQSEIGARNRLEGDHLPSWTG